MSGYGISLGRYDSSKEVRLPVMVDCPKTRRPISVGIWVTFTGFLFMKINAEIQVRFCERCGEAHTFRPHELYLLHPFWGPLKLRHAVTTGGST